MARISEKVQPLMRVLIVHGDKGGVGKSTTAQAVADQLMRKGVPVAIIDADTRNPDMIRMFENANCPRTQLNLRATDGWMDLMDFIYKWPSHTFVLSLPAGIGEAMQDEFRGFVKFLREFEARGFKVEIVMWWVINLFADSVNLLARALQIHQNEFDEVVVIRNLIFGPPEAFIPWNESPLKADLERFGIKTVNFPPLHLRVMSRLMNPNSIMPFSEAMKDELATAIGFQPSESHKLRSWVEDDVPAGLGDALQKLLVQPPAVVSQKAEKASAVVAGE